MAQPTGDHGKVSCWVKMTLLYMQFFQFFLITLETSDTVLFFAKKSVVQSYPQVCIVQRVAVLYAS